MIPYGGTIVRPGVIAWDGMLSGTAVPGYYSCEAIEQAIMAATSEAPAAGQAAPGDVPPGDDEGREETGRLDDLLGELARARLWLPLPDGAKRVTDGSAIVLPLVTSDGLAFVPAFTSVQRLATWCDPRTMRSDPAAMSGPVRSSDPAWAQETAPDASRVFRHIVVPLPGLASLLPPGLGIAINPGTRVSLRVYPEAMENLGQLAGP